MDETKNLIEKLPSAFAYHKIIYDKYKKVVDFVFLNVNEKFEKMTGLKKEDIEGKKASFVIENSNKKSFKLIEFYSNIALNEKNKTIKKYFESYNKWYEIKAYSEEKGYFKTFLYDITEKKQKER